MKVGDRITWGFETFSGIVEKISDTHVWIKKGSCRYMTTGDHYPDVYSLTIANMGNIRILNEAKSPIRVREVVTKEIVPGTYGIITILTASSKGIALDVKDIVCFSDNAFELREAARIFVELADFLEGK